MIKSLVVALIFLVGTLAFAKELVYRDDSGLPRCIETDQQSVLVVWDHLIQKSSRPVFGITLKSYTRSNGQMLRSCRDWPYAIAWPEGLQLMSDFSANYSESVRFDLQQIEEGAQVRRLEKTGEEFVATHSGEFQPQHPIEFSQMEMDYGSKFSNLVLNSWLAHLQRGQKLNSKNCASLLGTCDYYLCVEANHQCGVGGYPVGYGYKYCNRSLFGLLQGMESEQGHQWVQKTVHCLQTKLNGELTNSKMREQVLTCGAIKEIALNSHPDCYVDSGFCGMPMRDKLKVFNTVKSEILNTATVSQATKTLRRCAGVSEP